MRLAKAASISTEEIEDRARLSLVKKNKIREPGDIWAEIHFLVLEHASKREKITGYYVVFKESLLGFNFDRAEMAAVDLLCAMGSCDGMKFINLVISFLKSRRAKTFTKVSGVLFTELIQRIESIG